MNASFLTHQQILKLPFTYKIWLLIHLSYYDFIRWNDDGTIMLLDLAGLEVYLNSSYSIFNIENHSTFLQYLEVFQFEHLDTMPQPGDEMLLQYRNKYFQRYHLDVMPQIPEYEILQSIVLYQNESRILEELFKISDENVNVNESLQKWGAINITQKIDVSMELFENSHDPALQLMHDDQTNYIGLYENYNNNEDIMHVVGDYLPKYNGELMEHTTTNIIEMNENVDLNNVDDQSCAQSLPPNGNWDAKLNVSPLVAPLSYTNENNQENWNYMKQAILDAEEQNDLLTTYYTFDEILKKTNSLIITNSNSDDNSDSDDNNTDNNNNGNSNDSGNDNSNVNSNVNSNDNGNVNSNDNGNVNSNDNGKNDCNTNGDNDSMNDYNNYNNGNNYNNNNNSTYNDNNNSNLNNNNDNNSNDDDSMNECYETNVNFLATLGLMLKPKTDDTTKMENN